MSSRISSRHLSFGIMYPLTSIFHDFITNPPLYLSLSLSLSLSLPLSFSLSLPLYYSLFLSLPLHMSQTTNSHFSNCLSLVCHTCPCSCFFCHYLLNPLDNSSQHYHLCSFWTALFIILEWMSARREHKQFCTAREGHTTLR